LLQEQNHITEVETLI